MSTDRLDIRYVAKLARLDLTEAEVETYGEQLSDFLTHVDALRELETSDVPATAQVIASRNVGRDDVVTPCLAQEDVLAGAPQAYGPFIRVPRIIGGEG
jgi:aspartyl-tRNA(Asn)/glutamyl-tRNA(Gln) amidotransferase subunit C